MIDETRWASIMNQFNESGFGFAAFPSHESYGISLTRPSHLMAMVENIPGVRIGGYMERAWADNHDVIVLVRNDRAKPW